MADLAGRRTAHRNRPGRPGRSAVVIRTVVRNVRNRQPVRARAASPGVGRHIVRAGRLCRERQLAVIARSAVVVRGAADPVAVRVVDAPQIRVLQRAGAARRPVQVDPVGLARLQRHREPVLVARVADLARRRTAHRDCPGRPRRGPEIVLRAVRDIRHRQPVGAGIVFPGTGRHVICPARLRRERQLAVRAPAAVVVRHARDRIAVRVVKTLQVRIAQRAGAARCALQVNPVGLARLQGHREPVKVARMADLARRRTAHRNRPGRSGRNPLVILTIVRDIRHRHPVGARAATPGFGRHVIRPGRLRRELQLAVIARAAVVVRRAVDPVAVRVVDAPQIRVY